MLQMLAILLSCVFVLLALIHFNWAFGGDWGFDAALPTNENGDRMLNPKKIDSAIVGLGLSGFSLFYLLKTEIISLGFPDWILHYGGWIVPAIFILRAIGDFKYVGFFRKVKGTTFSEMDGKYFSPLCLGLGIIGLVIQVMA